MIKVEHNSSKVITGAQMKLTDQDAEYLLTYQRFVTG